LLEGLLSEGVVVCEAEGDRMVYESTYRSLRDEQGLLGDVRFVPVGGSGGFAEAAKLYRTLRVPLAVIADLDLVLKRDELERVLISLGIYQCRQILFISKNGVSQRLLTEISESIQ